MREYGKCTCNAGTTISKDGSFTTCPRCEGTGVLAYVNGIEVPHDSDPGLLYAVAGNLAEPSVRDVVSTLVPAPKLSSEDWDKLMIKARNVANVKRVSKAREYTAPAPASVSPPVPTPPVPASALPTPPPPAAQVSISPTPTPVSVSQPPSLLDDGKLMVSYNVRMPRVLLTALQGAARERYLSTSALIRIVLATFLENTRK